MRWLEQLLIAKGLQPPSIAIADGGLEAINEALDRLRNGTVSAKRIVVPIGNKPTIETNGHATTHAQEDGVKFSNLDYADKLNADPSRIKFA